MNKITLTNPFEGFEYPPRKWQSEALPILVDELENFPICRAVMGAGKSVMIAELCRQYDGEIIVTTPTKKLVEELSETISGVCRSVGRYYSNAKEYKSRVIVCCNMSLPMLARRLAMRGIDINKKAWIADECHRTETDTIKDVLEHWEPVWRVGFTATPLRSDDSEKISLFNKLAYNYGPWQAIKDGVIVPYIVHHPPHPRREINEECAEWICSQDGPGVVDAISIDDAKFFRQELEKQGRAAFVVHSKMNDREVQKRLTKSEQLGGALVHVDLLSEGVNMPWLRWLVVRRPTGSPVRFAQYVGRGLRSYPGKKNCPVFDPHDLFGELSIDPEAVLAGGEGEEPETGEEYAIKLDFLIETAKAKAEAEGKKLDGPPRNMLSPAASWVRRTSQEWKMLGVLPMRLEDGPLRREPVGNSQLETLSELFGVAYTSDIPDLQSQALKIALRVVQNRERVDWGTASDLIQVLKYLKSSKKWPTDSAGIDMDEKQGVL